MIDEIISSKPVKKFNINDINPTMINPVMKFKFL